MAIQPLDQPIVSAGALRTINFFNGRLLTGDDLNLEQATLEARDARIGRTLGEGVAYGLEVTRAPSSGRRPVVSVSPGVAVARSGAALELPAAVDVALDQSVPSSASGGPSGGFTGCQPSAIATYQAGAGVYLLAIAPAQTGEGRAQAGGLTGAGPCTVSHTVEAVTLKLIHLTVPPSELTDVPRLRNQIAYQCFGATETEEMLTDPFLLRSTRWGLLDTLRPARGAGQALLCDDEVPLATIGVSVDLAIEFVDLWSVRRRRTSAPAEGTWGELVSDRRRAEAEAMFLQFQAHMDDLLLNPSPDQLRAVDHFTTLPPVGLLQLPASPLRPGINLRTFFSNMTVRGPLFIEGAKVEALLAHALDTRPIDVAGGRLVWIYLVAEAFDPYAWGSRKPGGPYALFTSGEVRYAANPQFNLSRLNYANFALPAD